MENIILEFESKLKIIWWEKVYSAREIMKIFWYDKWERFLWAINRAKSEIVDEKVVNDNFFFVIDKETWWRPKEDVLLTLWACYFVLKKCDNRKENVIKMQAYLEELLEEKRIEQRSFKMELPKEKIVFLVIIFFLFISIIYYIFTFLSYFFDKNKESYDFSSFSNEFQIQESIQKSIINNYEKEIFQSWAENIENTWSEKLPNDRSEDTTNTWKILINTWTLLNQNDLLNNYILSDNKELKYFSKDYNYRSDFLKTLSGEILVKSFFELGNKSLYRDSCSLLSPKLCLSTSKSNLKIFSNFWEKTSSWNELLEVKKVLEENDKNVYCVKYKYKLKYDTSDKYITETFNYTTQVKNSKEQINWRYCEKIQKWTKSIACPYKLNNYYCK